MLSKIAFTMLKKLKKRLGSIGVTLNFEDEVCKFIAKGSYEKGFGARPVARMITADIENSITSILLTHKYDGLIIDVNVTDGKLKFTARNENKALTTRS